MPGEKNYHVSEVNFFEPSRDPISQERIKALLKSFNEIKTVFPDIHVAFSLFGSLSKGEPLDDTNAKDTDVDMFVYYDLNRLCRLIWDNPASEMSKTLKEVKYSSLENAQNVHWAFESYVESVLNKNLKENASTKFQSSIRGSIGVSPMPISKMMRDLDLAASSGYHQFAAMFFGYDIGGGLRFYINHLLTEISKKENKEELWEKVKKICIGWHRKGKISEELEDKIPETFEDACKVYGVNL